MAKKKKKSAARKKASATRRPATKKKAASRRKAGKRTGHEPLTAPRLRMRWDLETLMRNGLPDNKNKDDACTQLRDEAVNVAWVSEVLSEVTGAEVTTQQTEQILKSKNVPVITVEAGIGRPIFHAFGFTGSPKNVDPYTETFMHPDGMDVLEAIPQFAKLKKHKKWLRYKKQINKS